RFTPAKRKKLKAQALRLYRQRNGGGRRRPSVDAISRDIGVHWRTVWGWLQEEGVKPGRERYDYEAIARDVKKGKQFTDITREYGCSWWVIEKVKKKIARGEL